MSEESYVFDTYAMIEIIRGNPRYERYTQAKVIINEFILAELCWILIKDLGKVKAFGYIDEYAKYSVAVSKDIIKKAMLYRHEHIKRRLSMTDCLGYFLAKEFGIKFLTGDKEFKHMTNVEFVRKD